MMTKRTNLIGFTAALMTAGTLAFAAGAPQDEKTYVGCVTKSDGGTFGLNHILGASASASEIQLESSRVDLAKHVGEKVSVRGKEAANGGRTMLNVSFVKTLTKSCS